MSAVRILPAAPQYIRSYWRALDTIAREKIYLGVSQGFPWNQTQQFVLHGIAHGYPYYFAVDSNDQAVGWCDIQPDPRRDGDGCLGMGLLEPYRNRGLGKRMLLRALEGARAYGFTRIRLQVRASNARAIALYQGVGFQKIVRIPDGVCTDGRSEDVWEMALCLSDLCDDALRDAERIAHPVD